MNNRPFIILASGIYYLKHDKTIIDILDNISNKTKIATLTTSGITLTIIVKKYLRDLKQTLEKKGFSVEGQWYCPGYDQQPLFKPLGLNKNRPNKNDLMQAADFARQLNKKLNINNNHGE